MSREALRGILEYYRDLGIKTLYRRTPAGPGPLPVSVEPEPVAEPGAPAGPVAGTSGGHAGQVSAAPPATSPVAPAEAPTPVDDMPHIPLPSLQPEGDTMLRISQDIGDCKRCRLHQGRHKIVFGVGNEQSPLVFVGEGPGADEDAQGIPFVGRAGQLLTQMIDNTASREGIRIKRENVYICNVVKCRPPENRTPEPDEMEICGQFLYRQLMAIQPKAIVALGGTAAKALLGGRDGVTRMRGKWHKWHDIPVMVTYHPSYLLRPYNQNAKREAWEDLKRVLHYVYD